MRCCFAERLLPSFVPVVWTMKRCCNEGGRTTRTKKKGVYCKALDGTDIITCLCDELCERNVEENPCPRKQCPAIKETFRCGLFFSSRNHLVGFRMKLFF